ncbi:MAG TPA: hypothetical protein VND62_03825 [Acidimicrobiales bacterium]|nr:hypothetical protein [Acidimicrobiales bacterium]
MRRKTLDLILTAGGAVLTVVLIAAGALLMWGYNFTNDEVHSQLASQQVYFPTAAALAHAKAGTEITPTMKPYLLPYAGQQVTTGPQAKAYATHFIAIHLSEMPHHGVYAKVSAASRAKPTTQALAGVVQASFQGTTLRSMLLEAYGFSVFGELAFDGALAAFCAAFLMLFLTGLGLVHIRRTPVGVEFPRAYTEPVEKVA